MDIEIIKVGSLIATLRKNDRVSIKLDLIKAEIRYFVNGKDQGIAFQQLVKRDNIDYRLCICIYKENTVIEILHFQRYYVS